MHLCRNIFAGMLTCFDEGLGNITAALEAKDVWSQTLFVFSNDNGGATPACGGATGSQNFPLRGGAETSSFVVLFYKYELPKTEYLPRQAREKHRRGRNKRDVSAGKCTAWEGGLHGTSFVYSQHLLPAQAKNGGGHTYEGLFHVRRF
jgi:arylsulfatase A-like enzyme